MATFNSKVVIDEIIAGDGHYRGDPRVAKIVEYTNVGGHIAWGVTWQHEQDQDRYLRQSYRILNPRVIWEAS